MFEFKKGDALLVVDVQNDFLPCGRLAIDRSDEIIPYVNNYITSAKDKNVPIYYSLDWHPENHISFIENGGQWPLHCVRHTNGADLSPILIIPDEYDHQNFIYKGQYPYIEQYSAFDGTVLNIYLVLDKVKRLLITGLAFDVCVLETIKSAYKFGYDIYVDLSATKAVTEEGHNKTVEYLMKNEMVTFV